MTTERAHLVLHSGELTGKLQMTMAAPLRWHALLLAATAATLAPRAADALAPNRPTTPPSPRPPLIDIAEVDARRRVRSAGLAVGALAVSGALVAGEASPDVFDGALGRTLIEHGPQIAAAAAAPALGYGAWLGGRIAADDAPERSNAYGRGLTAVRAAGSGKGDGLFATGDIERDALVGIYPGERLDERALLRRYPDGLTEYVFALSSDEYLDADPRYYTEPGGEAERRASSGAVHKMNHAPARRANVRRDVLHAPWWPFGAVSRVAFYTTRAVRAGEELCFDYGPDYAWEARGVVPVVD